MIFSVVFCNFALKKNMRHIIYVIGGMLLLIGCETDSISKKLTEADSLVSKEEYDSAYQVVSSLDEVTIKNQEDMAHYNLLKVQTSYLVSKPLEFADSILDDAIIIFQKNKDIEKLTDAYYYKAVGYNRSGNYKKSIELYKQAELLSNLSNNKKQQFKIVEGITFVNGACSNFNLQLVYAKKALELAKEAKNKKWEVYSHYWLDIAYSELGYEDSAIAHLDIIPQYIKYIGENDLPYFLANIALEYKEKNPKIAKQYLQKSLSYKELTKAYEHLADISYYEGKQDEYHDYLKKALAVNDASPKDNIIRNLIEYNLERGQTDSISDMVTQIIEIRDSIDAKLKDDTIKDLQTRFDHEIALKEKDQIITRGILVAVVALFLLIGFYFWRRHLAKVRLLDYQMQIHDCLSQIEILKASGKDNQQEIDKMNEQIEYIMSKESGRLARGKLLYDDIMANKPIVNWKQEDEEIFLDYYTAMNYRTVQRLKNIPRKEKLTVHKLFFLVLVELGKTNEELLQILSISDATLRVLRFRTKPLE